MSDRPLFDTSQKYTTQNIINDPDPITVYMGSAVYASARRTINNFYPSLARPRNVPSVNVPVLPLPECDKEFDEIKREAKFAFRSTDLRSWNSSSVGGINTVMNPTKIQHWALVVHFPRGDKTYLFEAVRENGYLQAGRAENVNKEVFQEATYFGTTKTCPSELLEKAKQVPSGEYKLLHNNCQTWTRDFLYRTSPELLASLHKQVPATDTQLSGIAAVFAESNLILNCFHELNQKLNHF